MNLPIQAPPVTRGRHCGDQTGSTTSVGPGVAQSQLPITSKDFCALCALVPPPWNLVCAAACPIVSPIIFH